MLHISFITRSRVVVSMHEDGAAYVSTVTQETMMHPDRSDGSMIESLLVSETAWLPHCKTCIHRQDAVCFVRLRWIKSAVWLLLIMETLDRTLRYAEKAIYILETKFAFHKQETCLEAFIDQGLLHLENLQKWEQWLDRRHRLHTQTGRHEEGWNFPCTLALSKTQSLPLSPFHTLSFGMHLFP